MKIYLAGPMTGLSNLNFPAFEIAAHNLRHDGHEVFNPAELPEEIHSDLRECLARDFDYICRHAEAVALLPGWRNSKGATAEYHAALALGLRVIEI